MRAAVLVEAGRIAIEDRPEPVAGPGQVVMDVSHCGICGSDVHGYMNGVVIPPGTVMGHECSGVVSQVGDGLTGWRAGDRVVIRPVAECGTCHFCRKGRFSLCPDSFRNGLGLLPGADGAFAEKVLIRRPARMLFRLPDEISFAEASLIEPLATSLHTVRMSRFQTGDTTLVLGAGTIGLGVIQFLRLGGARWIGVVEPSAFKRELALKFGADQVFEPGDDDRALRKQVRGLTDGLGPEIVFECAGAARTVQSSVALVRKGGQVMMAGVNENSVGIRPMILAANEIELKGVFAYYDEFPLVIDFLRQGRIDAASMLSDVIPLADIEDAGFRRLVREPGLVKVAIIP